MMKQEDQEAYHHVIVISSRVNGREQSKADMICRACLLSEVHNSRQRSNIKRLVLPDRIVPSSFLLLVVRPGAPSKRPCS